ncbi:beta/alpha barrel domain-containing protein, partial [Staphylococcus epidermidis]
MIDLCPAIHLINSTTLPLTQPKYHTKQKIQKSLQHTIPFYTQFKSLKRIHILDLIPPKPKHLKQFHYIPSLTNLTTNPIQLRPAIPSKQT